MLLYCLIVTVTWKTVTALSKTSDRLELKVNSKRPKTMGVNQANSNSITMDGGEVEDVQQFTSLGSVVKKEGGTDQDIIARIGKATAAFKELNPIWRSQVISTRMKIRIFNTNVKTVLLYACETWRYTKVSIHKLQTVVNRCLRPMMHIKWQDRVTNKEL